MDSSSFLVKEYENLQNESRRKFPSVASVCKATIKALKSSKENEESL